MVGRRGVEMRDDGPTLAPRPYTPTVGVRLPSVKVRKGGSQGDKDNTLGVPPKPQTLAVASWLKFAIPKNEKDGR